MQQQQRLHAQQQNGGAGPAAAQQRYMQPAQQAQQLFAASSPAGAQKPTPERPKSVSVSQQHVNGMSSAAPERQESELSQQGPGPANLGAFVHNADRLATAMRRICSLVDGSETRSKPHSRGMHSSVSA